MTEILNQVGFRVEPVRAAKTTAIPTLRLEREKYKMDGLYQDFLGAKGVRFRARFQWRV